MGLNVARVNQRDQILQSGSAQDLDVLNNRNPFSRIEGHWIPQFSNSMSDAVRGSPLLPSLLPGYGPIIASVLQLMLI